MRLDLLVVATLVLLASPALAQTPEQLLIEEGRRLFTEETFEGNGRTCATCHPATNNFTIDPAFVRRLPRTDPLFITAPSGGELNNLEVVRFLNQAIILENLDTFGNPGVMRGVPHILGLNATAGRTGWSGDGSPGAGAPLRTFATGAVTQHFTKTLARRACTLEEFEEDPAPCDFRLPTEAELTAMEAFQRSLGRQVDPDLNALVFNDPVVDEGRRLFLGGAIARDGTNRACSGCHANGGTNDGQRATGANMLPTAPACLFGFQAPGDGGLGLAETSVSRRTLCDGKGPDDLVTFRGDATFNTPSVIEAADTPPFFHNNAVATLEGAVAFYTSDVFNASPNGAGRAFVLDQGQINAIAALLRALNALENIRSSNTFAQRADDPTDPAPADVLMAWGQAETQDAIEVLTEGPLALYPEAVALLRLARDTETQALATGDTALLQDAIELQEQAHDEIAGTVATP